MRSNHRGIIDSHAQEIHLKKDVSSIVNSPTDKSSVYVLKFFNALWASYRLRGEERKKERILSEKRVSKIGCFPNTRYSRGRFNYFQEQTRKVMQRLALLRGALGQSVYNIIIVYNLGW